MNIFSCFIQNLGSGSLQNKKELSLTLTHTVDKPIMNLRQRRQAKAFALQPVDFGSISMTSYTKNLNNS